MDNRELKREPLSHCTLCSSGQLPVYICNLSFFQGDWSFRSWKKEIQFCPGPSGTGRRNSNLMRVLPEREEEKPILCGYFHGWKKKIQTCAGTSTAGRRKTKSVRVFPELEEENPILCAYFRGNSEFNYVWFFDILYLSFWNIDQRVDNALIEIIHLKTIILKNLFTIIILFFTLTAFSQTAKEHFEDGITKHNQQDFKGAIKEYNNAIKLDKEYTQAYYNRGTCALALKDFKSALLDFNKTIELDPQFVNAYYSRATVFVSQEKYIESLPDLDKTIEFDPAFSNALTLRGQIRAQTGNKKGACEDFNYAKQNGDKHADKYLSQFCGNEQQNGESLMLYWPEEENWKVGSSQENEQIAMLELIHTNETLENWTEIGTMMSIKGARNIPMEKAMNLMYEQSKQKSPKAKLTFIEKDENVEYPWIIFTIESPNFKNDRTPESQLWYVVQGKTALYTNFRAIKQATIPSDLKDKWIKFFKTGKIVNK